MEREQDKVLKRLKTLSGSSADKLQKLIDEVSLLQQQISEAPPESALSAEQSQAVKECTQQLKEVCQGISSEHKDVHATISKFGRAIDKNFQLDISGICKEAVFAGEKSNKLNTVICEHLFRQGKLAVGEALMQEAGLTIDPTYIEQFGDLNKVLNALRNKQADPALEWAVVHRSELQRHGSSLEFQLRQIKFVSLVSSGRVQEALAYAKVLGQFAPKHTKEIKRLMGCFLFCHRGLESSPYSDLLDPWHWTDAADLFARDACKLLGLSLDSPLGVSLSAGCMALPQLLHLKTVMAQRQVSDMWTHRDELPCEVNLGWERRYHSVFTCPILRQQATDSNPPVRLVCGHSISRDAMKKLVSHSRRLKCPYCPMEMLEHEIKDIKF